MGTEPITDDTVEGAESASDESQEILDRSVRYAKLRGVQDCLVAALIGYLVGVNGLPWFTLI